MQFFSMLPQRRVLGFSDGLPPHGAPLLMHGHSLREIYSLDLKFP